MSKNLKLHCIYILVSNKVKEIKFKSFKMLKNQKNLTLNNTHGNRACFLNWEFNVHFFVPVKCYPKLNVCMFPFFACRPSAHYDAAAQPTSQGRRSSLIVMQSEGRSGAAGDLAQERQAAGGHSARQVPGHRLRAPRGRRAAPNRAGARRQGRSQL